MSDGTDTLEQACRALEDLYEDDDPIAGLEARRPDDDAVATQATVFGALANEHRIRLLEALREENSVAANCRWFSRLRSRRSRATSGRCVRQGW